MVSKSLLVQCNKIVILARDGKQGKDEVSIKIDSKTLVYESKNIIIVDERHFPRDEKYCAPPGAHMPSR